MKKLVLLAVAALAMSLGSASADPIETPVATLTVNEGGYLVSADGAEGNPDPADGFASVSDGGQACADDNGSPDDGNAENGPESTSPTCAP